MFRKLNDILLFLVVIACMVITLAAANSPSGTGKTPKDTSRHSSSLSHLDSRTPVNTTAASLDVERNPDRVVSHFRQSGRNCRTTRTCRSR